MKEVFVLKKEIYTRMGVNLGFVAKIILVDGTILNNMQVLYRSPIPDKQQIETILCSANEVSRNIFGLATPEWSAYPELERGRYIYEEEVTQ